MRNISDRQTEIAGIGSILLRRSRRAKRIYISITGPDAVRVAVPYGVSFVRAEEFVKSKKVWIARQIVRLREAMLLEISAISDIQESQKKLLSRLDTLSRRHGFSYHSAVVRNQKTRWASCSGKNNISLNIRLILLPDALIHYVLLHELVHTRVKDHGERFWDLLERCVKNARNQDRGLQRYRLS